MKFTSQAAVAIILAVTVLAFVVSGTVVRLLAPGSLPAIEAAQAWKELVSVIVGALAGYIGGSAGRDKE